MSFSPLWFLFLPLLSASQDSPRPPTPDERYQALFEEWQTARNAWRKASEEAKTEEEWKVVNALPGGPPRAYAARFMAIANEHPGTMAAENSLVWVGSHVMFGPETEQAKRRLAREYARSARVAPVFAFQVLTFGSESTETLLRESLTKNPHRDIRGLAHYWLGRFLIAKAEEVRQAKRGGRLKVELAPVVTEGWGKDVLDRLNRLDSGALDREAEALMVRVIREYPDIPHNDKIHPPGTLATVAAGWPPRLA
jgi:hypothetical protein